MYRFSLIYPTPEGSREIPIEKDKTSFGRGSEADHRFADDGLSRLHAVIYRDGERVWIVDENSSNGTFVNGQRVSGGGTPLQNGDSIRIGHRTDLKLRAVRESVPAAPPVTNASDLRPNSTGAAPLPTGIGLVPVVLIACAVLVFTLSAVFIGYTVLGSTGTDRDRARAERDDEEDPPIDEKDANPPARNDEKKTGPVETDSPRPADPPGVQTPPAPPANDVLKGRKYYELTDPEKRQYLSERAMKIAQLIGNNSTDPIPQLALDKIKVFTDQYAQRRNAKGMNGCSSKIWYADNLQATYERAKNNASFINKAFQANGVDSRIGLYLAMIESEHCVCLQSGTGPLGMFQFAYAAAMEHFQPNTGVVKGASPPKGDVRCEPEPAARAAASYMKARLGRFGGDPTSVPLAIGSYNGGQNGLSRNLEKALAADTGSKRDFWTMIANGEQLSKQFQTENFKYVPKFFAAAIIGENPQDFGLNLQPLSTY